MTVPSSPFLCSGGYETCAAFYGPLFICCHKTSFSFLFLRLSFLLLQTIMDILSSEWKRKVFAQELNSLEILWFWIRAQVKTGLPLSTLQCDLSCYLLQILHVLSIHHFTCLPPLSNFAFPISLFSARAQTQTRDLLPWSCLLHSVFKKLVKMSTDNGRRCGCMRAEMHPKIELLASPFSSLFVRNLISPILNGKNLSIIAKILPFIPNVPPPPPKIRLHLRIFLKAQLGSSSWKENWGKLRQNFSSKF